MIIVKSNSGYREETRRMASEVLDVCKRHLSHPLEITEVTRYDESSMVYLSFGENINQKSIADAIRKEYPAWEVRIF